MTPMGWSVSNRDWPSTPPRVSAAETKAGLAALDSLIDPPATEQGTSVPKSAAARLRGILLARGMTAGAVDQLLHDVAAEQLPAGLREQVGAVDAERRAMPPEQRQRYEAADAPLLRLELAFCSRYLEQARATITWLRESHNDALDLIIRLCDQRDGTAEPERCCMCGSADVRYRNYREQPFCWPCADGTSPQGQAAVAASLAEPNPVAHAADQPQPAAAGGRTGEIYTGPGSVGDVLARAFRATWKRGR
ncbi:hypothetical protein ACEZCY_14520 [Streptacidiphilus sp. N1-12]|uniref:Uncharacterized protein n=2 Tax=Streptacidiphilus alkalitolerans TaxID=3342712 RepID=A0ABV6V9R1_9ACTN